MINYVVPEFVKTAINQRNPSALFCTEIKDIVGLQTLRAVCVTDSCPLCTLGRGSCDEDEIACDRPGRCHRLADRLASVCCLLLNSQLKTWWATCCFFFKCLSLHVLHVVSRTQNLLQINYLL
ncbi:hypothetical protein ElyMa_000234300 [Elysia marginata]|uniref:Uncharacterized protein n=1 Tax=Elysia marginata TaxID=1093978 RepID=A0AAV4F2M1_9GAST|nr:hypothetical protein ElyMa_000234300 [Elysia marginata]